MLALAPGRKAFHEGLRTECSQLIGQVISRQHSHAEYLALRAHLFAGHAWKAAQAGARMEALAYLTAAIDTLHATHTIVWKHRVAGEWLPSPLPAGVDYAAIERSAHVWATSNLEFYGESDA